MKGKIVFGIFVMALIGFNATYNLKSNNGEINLNNLVEMNVSEAECIPDTWMWNYPPCNQRVESVISQCSIVSTVRTYTTSGGEICGTAWIKLGVLEMRSGYQTSYFTDTQSTETTSGTRVNCPTDGNNNDCVEYSPC